MKRVYYINKKTSAIMSYFENGNEYARVLEDDNTFLVSKSPNEIVNESFYFLGNSLGGATTAARMILNKKYKVPVSYSTSHNIVLIPCKSFEHLVSIVWLNHSHIQEIIPMQNNKTIVNTIHGHSFSIDMKTLQLYDKRRDASFLQTTLQERTHIHKEMTFLYDPNHSRIQLVKEDGFVNYKVKNSEENCAPNT